MIVSLHIPRTAGSSFRAYLRKTPSIRLKEDYGNPILVPSILRQTFAVGQRISMISAAVPAQFDCIHGHFLPFKYKGWTNTPEVKFITWFRDPADRIRSQYDYCFQSDKKVDKSPFQNKVARESWSFEAFIHHPHMINLYTKFLWRFPMDCFDFVGIVEHFETDFQYVCRYYFGEEKVTPIFGNQTESTPISPEEHQIIQSLNGEDYRLYQQALQLRAMRLQTV